MSLPEYCPSCDHKFSTLLRPKSKMQKKAMTMFLVGVGITFPWAAVVFLAAAFSPIIVVPESPRAGLMLVLIGFFIIFAPSLILGWLALKMPRIISLKCRQCDWSQIYFSKHGTITPKS